MASLDPWSDDVVGLYASIVVLTVLAAISVALRFISRGRILHVLGPTDWFMVVTLLLSIANTVVVGFHIPNGLVRRFVKLTPEERRQFLKFQYVGTILNRASLVLTKISVLLLFLNVFVVTWIRTATYVVMAAVVPYGIWVTASNIALCVPIHWYWDSVSPSNSHCIFSSKAKFMADTAVNTAFDFVILILPLPAVWSINLPWRQKLWLYCLGVAGLIVTLMSVLRFVFYKDALDENGNPLQGLYIVHWYTTEINLSIIIACVPTLKPLAAKLYPKVMRTRRSDGNEYLPTISSPPQRLRSIESIAL